MKKEKNFLIFMSFLFFLSGFSGLILEVIWTRRIALIFGSTLLSASATIAAFMFGLGVGAYLVGKYLKSINIKLIYLYAIIEMVIGLSAFIITFIIPFFSPLAIFISKIFYNSIIMQLVSKFFIIFLTLLIPCISMGATLPVLIQIFTKKEEQFGKILGTLYAINTLGASAGAFLSDFILVEHIGVIQTACFAGTINILVAVAALIRGRISEETNNKFLGIYGKENVDRIIYFILFITGFCSIAYEIIWIRMLVFFNGCDVFSFSSMLTTFLLGIFIGSILISKFTYKIKDKPFFLVIMFLVLGGLSFLINILFVEQIFQILPFIFTIIKLKFPFNLFIINFLLIFPSTILLGAIFPVTSKILNEKIKHPGQTVGEAYLYNTLGCIAGSLLTGLLIIPFMGLQGSIAFLSSLIIGLGAFYMFFIPQKSNKLKIIILILAVILITGIFVVPDDMVVKAIYYKYNVHDIIYQTEDKYFSIALINIWDELNCEYNITLFTDGFNMAGNSFFARNYTMSLSLVPILLHKNPEDVLVIAMGMANTLTAAEKMSNTKHIDCVELSQGIVKTVKRLEHIKKTLDSPKVNIIIDDGRNYLLTTDKKYDIITAEPPPPVHAGIVNLYSKEYYELCKKRLKENGITTQWLPTNQMSAFEARTILRAFQDVFPYTYIWGWEHPYMYFCLIGSTHELSVDYPALKKLVKENNELLENIGLGEPELFVGGFIKGPEAIKDYCEGIPPLTDNRPYIEYSHGNWGPDIEFYYMNKEENFPINIYKGEVERDKKEYEREIQKGLKTKKNLRKYLWGTSNNSDYDLLIKSQIAREIINDYPDNQYILYITGTNRNIIKHYTEKAEESPSEDIFFKLASINYSLSNSNDALMYIDLAIEKASLNKNKWFYKIYKALILENSGDIEKAVNLYEEFIKQKEITNKELKPFVLNRLEIYKEKDGMVQK